jgi:DNA replication and repair protein RecF
VQIRRLWLTDVRSYPSLDVEFGDGLCAVLGPNGVGKSNLLEAVGYLATLESFRGAPNEAIVRRGADRAVVRGSVLDDGREQLIEAELHAGAGRNRVLVNRQRLTRRRDLLGAFRVTVFSPDDLALIKEGPALRRGYLDRLLVSLDPRNDQVRADLERAIRQRNALLRQTHGRLDDAAALTLEVWDTKLVAAGERLTELRAELVDQLVGEVARAYADVAGAASRVELSLVAPWRERGLAAALLDARADELRRGVTLVGPHRDDLDVHLDGLPSRTHASQGEQRSLALALRLAGHRLVTARTGSAPVLLLDDVFSELDRRRSAALLASLPAGQALLSSATDLPSGVDADRVLRVEPGAIVAA